MVRGGETFEVGMRETVNIRKLTINHFSQLQCGRKIERGKLTLIIRYANRKPNDEANKED